MGVNTFMANKTVYNSSVYKNFVKLRWFSGQMAAKKQPIRAFTTSIQACSEYTSRIVPRVARGAEIPARFYLPVRNRSIRKPVTDNGWLRYVLRLKSSGCLSDARFFIDASQRIYTK